jgi:acyl-homoserine lactone acylase PvdQ
LAIAAAALVSAVAALAPPATGKGSPVRPYRDGDRSLTALNILPPGQGRYMNAAELAQAQLTEQQPPHNTDQLDMYDSLVQGAPGLHSRNLGEYFKDASFGVRPGDVERQYSPRPGVVVLRDRGFGVPHIYGSTRSDTVFGAGYVTAEDRLFMIDVLRHAGRGRVSEFLGASEANLALDCATWLSADYTEAELRTMLERRPADPEGAALTDQARQDVRDYTAGINAYIQEALVDPSKLPGEYPALQQVPSPWKVTDTVAVAAVIGANFGVGGGQELDNAEFLDALEVAGHTPPEGRAIFDDFRFADDPEAPTTADSRFDWNLNLGPVDPRSVARPDAGSAERRSPSAQCPAGGETSAPMAVDGPLGPIPLRLPDAASNALLVGPQLSATGRPLAVFGPQVGYWSPEILLELDMHGPGLHARGAAFPGISMYVLLGRGDGYGWSATSAGGDLVDTRAVRLCEPDGGPPTIHSDHYVRAPDGACVPIHTRTDSWVAKPTAGGVGPPTVVTMTTERVELAESSGTPDDLSNGAWGIVIARGEVDGQPVAYARQRSTYGAEVDSAAAYVEIMDPQRIDGAEDFHRAFGRFNFTFNWFYVDDRDTAFQLVGAHPLRASGTDIDLPVWDGPDWRWQGFLPFEGRPHVTSPSKGFITSWNNKQAPGFRASDGNWAYGPVHRSQPLDDRILAAATDDGKVDLVELVRAMADAATVDLRGDKVLPFMLQLIGEAGTPRLQRAVDLLDAWTRSGAHRRDLDHDGEYDHAAAVALMDAWWDRALEAAFRPVLGSAFDDVPHQHDDPPGPIGSAYIAGWYGQLQKDLRSVLGLPVEGAFHRQYCGEGEGPAACRAALLVSLDDAVAALEARYGNDPGGWDANEEDDFIRYAPLGVQGQRPMQWQNRPTFQQVLEFARKAGVVGRR